LLADRPAMGCRLTDQPACRPSFETSLRSPTIGLQPLGPVARAISPPRDVLPRSVPPGPCSDRPPHQRLHRTGRWGLRASSAGRATPASFRTSLPDPSMEYDPPAWTRATENACNYRNNCQKTRTAGSGRTVRRLRGSCKEGSFSFIPHVSGPPRCESVEPKEPHRTAF